MNSARTDRAVLLLLITLPFLLYLPCTLGLETLFAGDLFGYFLPYRYTLFQALHQGVIPQWETGALSGNPFCASQQGGCTYPLSLVYLLESFPHAFNLNILLHLSLGACGTYLWLREGGHSSAASLIAALVFLLGGPTLSMVNRLDKLQTLTWWPFALWGLELMADRLARAPVRWDRPPDEQTVPAAEEGLRTQTVRWHGFLILTGAMVLQVLGGGLELVLMSGLFLLAWVWVVGLRLESDPPARLGTLLKLWRQELSARVWLLFKLGVACILALLLVAPQLWLLGELLSQSTRAGGLALERTLELSLRPADLLGTVLARAYFVPETLQFVPVAGQGSQSRYFYGLYLGGLPLVALLTGLLAPSRRFGRTRDRLACVLLGALAVLLALGGSSELSRGLYEALPPLRSLRYPEKFLSLLGMAALPLIAHGVDTLARFALANRLWLAMLGTLATLGAVTPELSLRLLSVLVGSCAGGHPALWFEHLQGQALTLLGPILLTFLGLLALLAARVVPAAAALLPGLVAFELAWLNLPLTPAMPVHALLEEPRGLSALLEPVRKDLPAGRQPRLHLLPLYTGEALEGPGPALPVRQSYLQLKNLLYPNLGQLFGLEVPDGARAIRLLSHARFYARLKGLPVEGQVALLEQAGVEVIASLDRLEAAGQERKEGPQTETLSGLDRVEKLGTTGRLSLFRLKHARRAWLETPSGEQQPVALEGQAGGQGLIVRSASGSAGPAGRLIVTESAYPGWKAWVDGHPAALEPDPLGWRLVLSLPAGWKTARMHFEGGPGWLGLLTLAGVGGLVTVAYRRRLIHGPRV